MINEDSAFGPGMMFGIPGPGPKKDTKGIPSDPKKEKGKEIGRTKMKKFKQFVEEDLNIHEASKLSSKEDIVLSFESYISESELNELALTSTGVKGLLQAIYYNWDQIKDRIKTKYYMSSFRDVIAFIKSGDQEEQKELEVIVKDLGIEILDLDDKRTWDIR
jgi:hypothetical protein